ncbi:hypothetical protein BC835DRAFT_440318 [Cytidiella melzeri]|nr:hypothetical protein BC835DRAFT_440318 [Cytidiella melzeri]
MRNLFLIARTVFFCILVYLHTLSIGFAAWNISAIKSAGLSMSGAPLFIIFNACTMFFFLLIAIAELAVPSAQTAQVGFECGWTALLAVIQLAAAIDVTVNGPPDYCSAPGLLAVCSSSTVLVAIAWASSTILMIYFLTLFITSVSHSSTYGAVWWTTVYTMPWFENPYAVKVDFPASSAPPRPIPPRSPYENPCFKAHDDHLPLTPPSVPFTKTYQTDLESFRSETRPRADSNLTSTKSEDSCKPGWAKRVNTRRGVDPPFSPFPNAAKRISRALKSYWTGESTVPPTPPPKPSLPVPDNLNGGFIDCHRASYGHFPNDVDDMDLPIARTHMREWVKAERAVLAH